MKLLVNGPQTRRVHVGVDLRGGDIGVSEHFLHASQVGAVGKQFRREAMPQGVRRDVAANA